MMRRLAAIAVTSVCLAACGGEEKAVAPAAAPAAPPAAAQPAPATPPSAPVAPAPAAKPDAAAGAALYAANCASCHGARGDGDGPASAALDPKPARHSDGTTMNALSNEHLYKVIQQGGPAVGKSAYMAPWAGVLSEAQTWDVIAFLRSLAKPPYPGPTP